VRNNFEEMEGIIWKSATLIYDFIHAYDEPEPESLKKTNELFNFCQLEYDR
jgi:hypothetical protein